MTFVNVALVWGAIAFTIPLAIHLLFRSRFRTVDWGAMHLLSGILQSNRRRLKWMQWLLLLLRCLIPILLAAVFARPILTGFRTLPGELPQSLVLVIDDSRSMSARDDQGVTRMTKAQAAAVSLLADLTRRDEVFVLPTSRLTEPPGASGPGRAETLVKRLKAEHGPFTLDRAIDAATDALRDAAHSVRRVIVLSDFAADAVSPRIDRALDRLGQRHRELKFPPQISFLSLGNDSQSLTNLSIDRLVLDSPAAIAGRRTAVVAEVRNASDRPAAGIPLVWSVDGRTMTSRPINVPAQGSTFVRLRTRIPDAGVHEVSVAIEVADAIKADNRRRLAIDSISMIDVLLVDGRASSTPLAEAGDFLFTAMRAERSDEAEQETNAAEKFRVRRLPQRRLTTVPSATLTPVVILSNVHIDDAMKSRLVEYVADGGHLVIFDGNRLDPRSYNEAWRSDGLVFELPMRLGHRIAPSADAPAGSIAIAVAPLDSNYEPWEPLQGGDGSAMSDVRINAYRMLEPRESTTDSEAENAPTDPGTVPPRVLMRSEQGLPLASIGTPRWLGQRDKSPDSRRTGRVVQFAFSPHPSETNLPLRPAFVPLLQQMLLDLAGRRSDLNLQVGDTLVLDLNRELESAPEILDDGSATSRVQIEGPDGDRLLDTRVDRTAGQSQWPAAVRVGKPGRYTIRMIGTATKTTSRVVEVPASESDLRDASSERMDSISKRLDAKAFDAPRALIADDRIRRYGREIWRPALFGLLLLMMGEIFLLHRLTGHRQIGMTGSAAPIGSTR